MSDFLSRLVERTFGLTTVIQPVIGSIFTPELSEKNGYTQDLIQDSKSVSSRNNTHTNGSRKTKTERDRSQPAFNSSRSFSEDHSVSTDQVEEWDNQDDFSSISKPQYKREQNKPFKQNDSGYLEQRNSQEQTNSQQQADHQKLVKSQEQIKFQEQTNLQEQIKSLHLRRISEENQYLHRPPAELTLDDKSLYKDSSDTSGTVVSELLYAEGRNDQGVSKLLPESKRSEEQFYGVGFASKGYPEPVMDNADSSTGTGKSHVSELTLISADSSNPKSDEPILKDNKPVSKADSGLPGNPYHGIRPLHVIPGRQSLRQLSTQKANSARDQTGKTLIEQSFVASASPSTRPTIKVTIGHIEVRAVKPPVTPQPQAPPQRQHPILSLDDYLKQYNG
jgi:hypothetical protein